MTATMVRCNANPSTPACGPVAQVWARAADARAGYSFPCRPLDPARRRGRDGSIAGGRRAIVLPDVRPRRNAHARSRASDETAGPAPDAAADPMTAAAASKVTRARARTVEKASAKAAGKAPSPTPSKPSRARSVPVPVEPPPSEASATPVDAPDARPAPHPDRPRAGHDRLRVDRPGRHRPGDRDPIDIQQGGIGRAQATDIALSQGGIGIAQGDRVSVEMGAIGRGDRARGAGLAGASSGRCFARDVEIEQSAVWSHGRGSRDLPTRRRGRHRPGKGGPRRHPATARLAGRPRVRGRGRIADRDRSPPLTGAGLAAAAA